MSVLPKSTETDESRMKQPEAESTSIPTAQATTKISSSESKKQRKSDLICGGRRCSTCGRCRDWKLIDGGNWKSYADWHRVSDPDRTCRYSHIRHVISFLSWNCKCNQ
ncbi:unnamed protein product [Rotaria sordida]|uniref:Uncharacterized protein n=1 Tax=Rotaria sordida TaxID=392033 RepID=A0A814QSW7_9BILA|nr:unnamed protein product [Rotaria sordida]